MRRIVVLFAMLSVCLSVVASAQALTTPQLQALKANIAASADTVQAATPNCGAFGGTAVNAIPNTPDGNACLASVYNLNAAPDFWVWRTALTEAEATQVTSVDGTTFTWVGNGFITRSVGEQTAWARLFGIGVNPSLASVRTAFNDILSGTGNAASNRTHLLTVSRRKATRAEKLFSTGTGSTASPATMAFEGPLSASDILNARNS